MPNLPDSGSAVYENPGYEFGGDCLGKQSYGFATPTSCNYIKLKYEHTNSGLWRDWYTLMIRGPNEPDTFREQLAMKLRFSHLPKNYDVRLMNIIKFTMHINFYN